MTPMDTLIELAQLVALAYLAWRSRAPKPVDLRQLVRSAIEARIAQVGGLKGGRDRLRARLASKHVERSTGE